MTAWQLSVLQSDFRLSPLLGCSEEALEAERKAEEKRQAEKKQAELEKEKEAAAKRAEEEAQSKAESAPTPAVEEVKISPHA